MEVSEILKAAGSTALSIAFPGVWPAVTKLVNAFVSDDDKLDGNATGDDINKIVKALPIETQAVIYKEKVDLAVQHSKERIALSNDKVEMQRILERPSQRGMNINKMVNTVIAVIVIYCLTLLICSGIQLYIVIHPEQYPKSVDVFKALPQWDMILSLLAPLIWCIRSYFGDRSSDTANGLRAQLGHKPIVPSGIIGAFASRIQKGN